MDRIKSAITYMFLIALCCSISACEAGNDVIGIELVTYPNKIYYVIGIDKELDLDGGTAQYIKSSDKNHPDRRTPEQMDSDNFFNIRHDIDFNKEGIYIVYVERWEFVVSFPIQVVSLEEVKRIIESTML